MGLCWALGRAARGERWRAVAALVGMGAVAEAIAGRPGEAVLAGAALCLLAALVADAAARVARAGLRRALFALLVLAALLLPSRAILRAVPPLHPLSVAVLSSVPLGPVASGSDEAGERLLSVLRGVGPVTLLDSMPDAGPGTDRLLLLQPRRLSPAELVAIDAWARRGGRTLVLADPHLDWERPFPLGDPRNPVAASLLDPLLEHWGARLELEDRAAARPNGLALPSPGEWRPLSADCRPCRVSGRCAAGWRRARR